MILADFPVEQTDTFKDEDDKNSSSFVLKAIDDAKKAFEDWESRCQLIDDVYSLKSRIETNGGWLDSELDLFWSSYEILKPAVYARPPQPVVSTQFKDRDPVKSKTAELLERVSVSAFDRSNIDDVMIEVRDDLIFTNRGVMWLTYESDDGQKVCIEHLDRCDFLHEPARKWSEVGWVARRAWMSKKELKKRFGKESGDAYEQVSLTHSRRNDDRDGLNHEGKGSVWEVWHKADNKVYWVSENVDVFLDEGEPHLKLSGFFPCPRPAYGTLQRRSLVPVPDYERYAVHFNKINVLTARIYLLLNRVKLKGLIPSGGDVGDAIQQLIDSDNDEMFIAVPAVAMMDGKEVVQWLPLEMVATAIQGLIEARRQLIDDFYQLSGISDIMRGATEADETLGAQRIKTQMGSVRVREKIDELQRIAADTVRIAAEIIAENFNGETLLEMSQMIIHKKSDIEKQIKGVEEAAEKELEALASEAEKAIMAAQQQQMMQGQQQGMPEQGMQGGEPQADPNAEMQAQFAEQQQAIMQKYAPMLMAAKNEVPLEDVMKLLRDDKSRCFAFEIASDSTVLTDELQEKQSRLEFMEVLNNSVQGVMQLVGMGEPGAALAGQTLKFVLGPWRIGRELDSVIDNFIEAAPEMAAQMQGAEGEEDTKGLIEAQNKLAEAEMAKAQAQTMKVQSDAQLREVELQGKMQELQLKAGKDQADAELKVGQLQLQMSKQEQEFSARMAETEAKINKMQAETAKILSEIGLDVRKQNLEEYKTQADTAFRAEDQVMRVEEKEQQVYESERDAQFRERGEERADRDQQFNQSQPRD